MSASTSCDVATNTTGLLKENVDRVEELEHAMTQELGARVKSQTAPTELPGAENIDGKRFVGDPRWESCFACVFLADCGRSD